MVLPSFVYSPILIVYKSFMNFNLQFVRAGCKSLRAVCLSKLQYCGTILQCSKISDTVLGFYKIIIGLLIKPGWHCIKVSVITGRVLNGQTNTGKSTIKVKRPGWIPCIICWRYPAWSTSYIVVGVLAWLRPLSLCWRISASVCWREMFAARRRNTKIQQR